MFNKIYFYISNSKKIDFYCHSSLFLIHPLIVAVKIWHEKRREKNANFILLLPFISIFSFYYCFHFLIHKSYK